MRPSNYIKTKGNSIEICLDVIFKKEGNSVVSYAPALELSGCGKDMEEARRSFEIVLKEYVRYTKEKGTLEADLIRHNWKKEIVRSQHVYKGLDFSFLLATNDLAKSLSYGDFTKSNQQLTVSC